MFCLARSSTFYRSDSYLVTIPWEIHPSGLKKVHLGTLKIRIGPKPDRNFFISNENIDCRRFTNIWITNHTNSNIFFIETEFIATFFFFYESPKRVSRSLIRCITPRSDWSRRQILVNRDSVL